MTRLSEIQANLARVREHIARAARSAGRSPDAVRLVVVTKGHPLEVTEAAIQAGAQYLGENYAEEGVEKMSQLEAAAEVEWHMIGHLQSRKANLVGEHFDYFHALDSLKLARRLDRVCAAHKHRLPVLLEFNVSGEETKFGWRVPDEAALEGIYREIEDILSLGNLEVRGLMTMAPYSTDPEDARPYFRRLRQCRDLLASRFSNAVWDELSMGMSDDFEPAIQEGATWVRIGTAILGPRPQSIE